MGKPAARISDMHTCPMVNPGPVPHVGGPISGPGAPTVLIGWLPAARVGDMAVCTGPPDTIASGSLGVLIENKPAARLGDMTAHGGTIVQGQLTVLIGDIGSPSIPTSVGAMAVSGPGQVVTAQAPTQSEGPLQPVPPSQNSSEETSSTQSSDTEDADDAPTWIGFQLLTHDGQPIADEPFSTTLDSGQTLSGTTDSNGYAEFRDIARPGGGTIKYTDVPFDDSAVDPDIDRPASDTGPGRQTLGSRSKPRPSGPPATRDATPKG